MLLLADLNADMLSYSVVSLLLYLVAVLVVVTATEPRNADEKKSEPRRFIEYHDFGDYRD